MEETVKAASVLHLVTDAVSELPPPSTRLYSLVIKSRGILAHPPQFLGRNLLSKSPVASDEVADSKSAAVVGTAAFTEQKIDDE